MKTCMLNDMKKNQIYSCSSPKCEYQTNKSYDLQKHLKICRYVEFDTIISHLQQTHKNEVEQLKQEMMILRQEHKNEVEQLKQEITSLRQNVDKEQERVDSIIDKVASKPVITNTTHTNNTSIKGNNNSSVNHLQTILASHDFYNKQTDPERIKSIDPAVVEKHFWAGQKGIARLSVKDIINVVDEGEEKMIICCTDPSRRRFKCIDENNNIVDDVDARQFIDKTAPALVNECRNAYDRIINKIEDNKKKTTDAFERDGFDNKSSIAQQKLIEISNIGDHNRNTVYKNEMARLLKK
jgi:hypothetical protein